MRNEKEILVSFGEFEKVEQMGENQFSIHCSKGNVFQSYSTIIGFISDKGKVYLDEQSWDYSKTTSKYRNRWLNMDTSEIKAGIKNGSIILTDLNIG